MTSILKKSQINPNHLQLWWNRTKIRYTQLSFTISVILLATATFYFGFSFTIKVCLQNFHIFQTVHLAISALILHIHKFYQHAIINLCKWMTNELVVGEHYPFRCFFVLSPLSFFLTISSRSRICKENPLILHCSTEN